MSPEPKKRPRRIPFTPEEVAAIIAAKKRREQMVLSQLKKSLSFKLQNFFNVCCFFIYWEILICFLGPANYFTHYYTSMEPRYGESFNSNGKPILESIIFNGVNGQHYEMMVYAFEPLPPKRGAFMVATDFILQKELKGAFNQTGNTYRLFNASPVLIIILLALITSTVGYIYNLNHNAASLTAITVLNSLCLFAVICL